MKEDGFIGKIYSFSFLKPLLIKNFLSSLIEKLRGEVFIIFRIKKLYLLSQRQTKQKSFGLLIPRPIPYNTA